MNWRKVWLLSFAIWALLALLNTHAGYVQEKYSGLPPHSEERFALWFMVFHFLLLATCTPLILWCAIHYPLVRGHLRKPLPLYALACIVFAIVHSLLVYITHSGWAPGATLPNPMELIATNFYISIHNNFYGFWFVVIAAHVIVYHRQSEERALRASQLQAQVAEAKLQALNMQLQPHFLFNTLHSISGLMHSNVNAADRMMTQLSDLLRMTLDTAEAGTTNLQQEVEFLRAYLGIQQTRFSDRLSITMNIAEDTYDAVVPFLLLQPIVENAVLHGISKLESDGNIALAAHRADGWLDISVEDNGPGFDRQKQDNSGTGIGLTNTKQRLQAIYGDQHRFSVEQSPSGVLVKISIPFSSSDGEPSSVSAVPSSNGPFDNEIES